MKTKITEDTGEDWSILDELLKQAKQMNKREVISRMQPHYKKLVAHYESLGVTFRPKQDNLENVVFTQKLTGKELCISYDVFYRFSGICCTHRDKGENSVEVIPLTDAAFYNVYLKAVIDMTFFPKEKTK
jgi:hypothetical protein